MDAVIVTSDSAHDLGKTLSSDGFSGFDRLIVVDNGSQDDSRDIARRAGAIVLERPTKSGYGAAVNFGARHTRGAVFAIVNPDVAFDDPGGLSRLQQTFANGRVAVAAPALELPNGSIQDSARCVPTPFDLLLRRKFVRRLGSITTGGVVPWVTGACLLVRRKAFDQIGGFDEGYPLYFEDVDLCVRLGRMGWLVVYVPEVALSHCHHAASRGTLLSRPVRLHARSAARFYCRNPRHLLVRGTRAPRSSLSIPSGSPDRARSTGTHRRDTIR